MRLPDSRLYVKNNVLKFKGDPHETIDEDLALLFKAIYTAVKYDLVIDIQDWVAIQDYVFFLKKIPFEERKKWIDKSLLLSNRSLFLDKLRYSGYLKQLFVEIYNLIGEPLDPKDPASIDIFDQVRIDVDSLPDEAILEDVWATLLKRVESPFNVLERFRFNKKFIENVVEKIEESNRD